MIKCVKIVISSSAYKFTKINNDLWFFSYLQIVFILYFFQFPWSFGYSYVAAAVAVCMCSVNVSREEIILKDEE